MPILTVDSDDTARTIQADHADKAQARAGINRSINTYYSPIGYIQMGSWLSGGTHHVQKAMLRFPLTDPVLIGCQINVAKLWFYIHTTTGVELKMFATKGNQSIPVVVNDWDNNLAGVDKYGEQWASRPLNAYAYILLNAAGIQHIIDNIGGNVKFCIRSEPDYGDSIGDMVYTTHWNTYGIVYGSLPTYLELDYASQNNAIFFG